MAQTDRKHTCILDGVFDAHTHAEAVGAGVRHVVRVARQRPTQILADDVRSALLRMLQRLHDEDAGAFAHDEAVAALVPRPRRALHVLVVR